MLRVLIVFLSSLLLAGCSVFGIRSSYEQPEYRVVSELSSAAEIREYEPRLAAQATVEAENPEAGRSAAFRLLFDYISGENRPAAEIAMTTPVATEGSEESVAMTVPVESAAERGKIRMRFFLPEKFTKETAPAPVNSQVEVVALPAKTLAVLRFSGSTDQRRLEARVKELRRLIEESEWRADGPPRTMFYDPPWTIPFLRRNEVAIPVSR